MGPAEDVKARIILGAKKRGRVTRRRMTAGLGVRASGSIINGVIRGIDAISEATKCDCVTDDRSSGESNVRRPNERTFTSASLSRLSSTHIIGYKELSYSADGF